MPRIPRPTASSADTRTATLPSLVPYGLFWRPGQGTERAGYAARRPLFDSATVMALAAPIRVRWLNAWGKLPTCR